MPNRILVGLICAGGFVISESAFAWFIWIPTGRIAQALETDPDSVIVSSEDRVLGKCAGLHANQARKFASPDPIPSSREALPSPQNESAEFKFHKTMEDLAVSKANDKDKVKTLADAYGVRWSRVAGADRQAAQTYGADLARGCASNDIPTNVSQFAGWQARQDEGKRARAEEEQKRVQAEEQLKRAREAEEAKHRATARVVDTRPESGSAPAQEIDFTAEARKSARILGCPTSDVRVSGTDGKSILFSAVCESGQLLHLTCDQSGLCLKR